MSTQLLLLAAAALAVLAATVGIALRITAAQRRRTHGELIGHLKQMQAQIDEIRQASDRHVTDHTTLADRIEAQITATRNDLEWLMGDRLMEMADRFVRSGNTTDPLAEVDLPADMARTIALFRKH